MLTLIITLGFMRLTPQPNDRVLHVQPLIKTQGFTRFTLNHLHRFYMDHPKRSLWVLYGSPKTFIMGFMWFTRNQHHGFIWITRNLLHGFYDNPFRENKCFNICLITPINQSIRVLCGLPTSTNFFKNTQTTNLFTVTNYEHHIQLDKHRPYSLDLLR